MGDTPAARRLHRVEFAAERNEDGLAAERSGGRDEAI